MRVTTRTNLAMRVLMSCAVNPGRTLRSPDIAQACNASLNHLMQVVNLLHQHGFIRAHRGRTGGIQLARTPGTITVGEVFRVLESGRPVVECLTGETNTCPLTDHCRLRGGILRAVEAFYSALDDMTLQDLVADNCGLTTVLQFEDGLHRRCLPPAALTEQGPENPAPPIHHTIMALRPA